MNTKIIFSISSLLFSSLFFAHAVDTKNVELYTTCKKNAAIHRDQTIAPALKEYVESSQKIAEKAKHDFDNIRWYISSSYKNESRKITDTKKQAMIPVTEKITKARTIAQNTWKAEDSLCEFLYNKASTTPATENKSKKK